MNLPTTLPSGRAVAGATRPMNSAFSVLQREVDRLFDDFGQIAWPSLGSSAASIHMDLAETKDGIELTAELPGLQEKDVEVSVAENVLTISGEKRDEREETDKDYRLVERSYGAFSRSISLPADAQADKINASMTNGVLKVVIPRAAKTEAKKIEVKAGG